MPRDEWRRANHRARYGPVGNGHPKPKTPRKKGKPHVYRIDKGVRCMVRKVGEKTWRRHMTTLAQTLKGQPWRPGYLMFRRGEYEMVIAGALIRRHGG